MVDLFHSASESCSQIVTSRYSTSFSSAIRMLHRDLRTPIRNIYGFVRFADEIVDSFHDHDKATLLDEFRKQTFEAFDRRISLNPILNSFQRTVHDFDIDISLVEAFFHSMEMDLSRKRYDEQYYKEYIYGSAEAVGLMCLHVFCGDKKILYKKLAGSARSLGAAFQKVNFLRDVKADYNGLSRIYFPHCDFNNFCDTDKWKIEEDIYNDFTSAYTGILQLPFKARFGVYVAYKYYYSLFKKIRRLKPAKVLEQRVRIPNMHKAMIIFRASVKNQLRLI
jgi:phytoene synthase